MKAYSFYFNASDWLASPAVKLMSKAERGVYINLLALAWGMERPGTLPASADKVRRLAEMSTDEWAESGEILLEKFPLSECGTYRYNPRLVAEAEKEQLRSEKNAEAGRKSAEKRAAEKAVAEAALQRKANAKPTGVEINPTGVEKTGNENPTIRKGKVSKELSSDDDSAGEPSSSKPDLSAGLQARLATLPNTDDEISWADGILTKPDYFAKIAGPLVEALTDVEHYRKAALIVAEADNTHRTVKGWESWVVKFFTNQKSGAQKAGAGLLKINASLQPKGKAIDEPDYRLNNAAIARRRREQDEREERMLAENVARVAANDAKRQATGQLTQPLPA